MVGQRTLFDGPVWQSAQWRCCIAIVAALVLLERVVQAQMILDGRVAAP